MKSTSNEHTTIQSTNMMLSIAGMKDQLAHMFDVSVQMGTETTNMRYKRNTSCAENITSVAIEDLANGRVKNCNVTTLPQKITHTCSIYTEYIYIYIYIYIYV